MKKLILIALTTLLLSITTQAQARRVHDSECADLWRYVYTPSRFSIDNSGPQPPLRECMSFEGHIEGVDRVNNAERDGDITFTFYLDEPFTARGFSRVRHVGGEVICAEPVVLGNKPVTLRPAKDKCAEFSSNGRHNLYSRGELNKLIQRHVRITGYLVVDYGHDENNDNRPDHVHMEIHPVARITILR